MVCLKFYISKNSCQSFWRPSLVLPKADYHSGGRKYRNIASLTLSRLLSRSLSLTRSLSFQQLPSSRWASLSSQCFPPFLSPALSLPLSPLHLSSLSFSLTFSRGGVYLRSYKKLQTISLTLQRQTRFSVFRSKQRKSVFVFHRLEQKFADNDNSNKKIRKTGCFRFWLTVCQNIFVLSFFCGEAFNQIQPILSTVASELLVGLKPVGLCTLWKTPIFSLLFKMFRIIWARRPFVLRLVKLSLWVAPSGIPTRNNN